jgi:hypothetical protein
MAERNGEAAHVGEPFLAAVHAALTAAHGLKTLPDDYRDVTQGFLASWKRRVKQKLLNNFRRAYVDVLSRQQSAFNDQVLLALAQLADCCAVLGQSASANAEVRRLRARLRQCRREQKSLRRRLAALEQQLGALPDRTPPTVESSS